MLPSCSSFSWHGDGSDMLVMLILITYPTNGQRQSLQEWQQAPSISHITMTAHHILGYSLSGSYTVYKGCTLDKQACVWFDNYTYKIKFCIFIIQIFFMGQNFFTIWNIPRLQRHILYHLFLSNLRDTTVKSGIFASLANAYFQAYFII